MSLNSLPLLCFRLGPVERIQMKRLLSIHRGLVQAERAEQTSITNYPEKNDPEEVSQELKKKKNKCRRGEKFTFIVR